MNNRLKRALQYLISLGLMALFLHWAFKGIDAAALWESIRHISLFWVGVMVLTTLGTILLRAWRWIVLMRPFTSAVSLWDASVALCTGYAANALVPRSGEVLRALSLKWKRDTPTSAVMATVVVERIFDLIWLIFFLGLSLLLLRQRINAAFPIIEPLILLALFGCIAALLVLALVSIYRQRALDAAQRLLGRISARLAALLVRVLGTFAHGLETLHTPSAYMALILSSLALNLGYVLIIYESFLSFNFQHRYDLDLSAALVTMAISSIGVVIPSPGGTGSYHFFFGQALILLYGLPDAQAMACATAVHAMANLLYLSLGGPALLIQYLGRPREEEGATVEKGK